MKRAFIALIVVLGAVILSTAAGRAGVLLRPVWAALAMSASTATVAMMSVFCWPDQRRDHDAT